MLQASPQNFIAGAPSSSVAQQSSHDQDDSFDSLFEDVVSHNTEDLHSHQTPSQFESADSSSSAPAGVIKIYLASLKEKIAHEIKGGSLPKCYVNGQFWIHPPHPYFAMQKGAQKPGGLEPYPLYHPSVFLWLPHLLDKSVYLCPMPSCLNYRKSKYPLTVKGWNYNPIAHRVVALDHVYYIMTQCVQCAKKTGGCGKSWNLGMAHGLSSGAWADILHELNIRRHDLVELAYLHAIYQEKKKASNLGIEEDKYIPFSQFDDKDCYAGFSPSRWYLSVVYQDYMEHIQPVLDQCMSALTGHIIKWDHSFKLPKLLAKLDGVATFTSLFTLVNEFEQIRFQTFVPTKSLSHICASLEKFSEALSVHGHPQPIFGFTDNPAGDAATFVQHLPSLGEDVVSISTDEHPEFPTLTIPTDVSVVTCETMAQIQSACDIILGKLPAEPEMIHVGFDMEWDFTAGPSGGPKATALVQIALPTEVYLLRTCFLENLPKALEIILGNTRIVKIGRNIGADFAKLAHDFPNIKLPPKIHRRYDGTIELGVLAKKKGVVPKATASLQAITAAALHYHLSKESHATEWSAEELSREQTTYAALDAWVALEIWNTIKDFQSQGCPLDTASPVGQPVSLFVRKQEVARGIIADQPS